MKTKATILFFLLTVFSVTNLKAGRLSKDSVQLTGVIFNNSQPVRNLVIRIYDHNKLIKTVEVERQNKFVTNIPLNGMLTIEINSEDYHTKRFLFDTNVPEMPKSPLKYHFDIDIFKEEELAGVNTSMLDFPVGKVYYDEKKKTFVRNKKYTKQMKKTYLKLWAKAQANRQGEGLD